MSADGVFTAAVLTVSDTRSAPEVAAALRRAGYDPVWKDWQRT